MYDINFFRQIHTVKEALLRGDYAGISDQKVYDLFEQYRSRRPFIFNVETTNNCNMRCIMCPRTNLMTREIETMEMSLFKDIIDQVPVHTQKDLALFDQFVQDTWKISPEEMSENAFYFYISSRHLTLHGFGEPLVDPMLAQRIEYCTLKGVPTYFSCVPANINVKKLEHLMDMGTGVIKFSMDALDDGEQKRIRGKYNNFSEAYKKILEVLKVRDSNNYKTKIVLTLIALSEEQEAKEIQDEFIRLWKNEPVYSYVKSQDNRWLYEEDRQLQNRSHYEIQYCEFPWLSTTVMADGSVVPCTQDYDTEIVLGKVPDQTLEEIWNNVKYREFRRVHLTGKGCQGLKCAEECDQKLAFERRIKLNVAA